MERKIGEIFEYNGEWYQCVGGICRNCIFCYDIVCKNITTIGSTNFGNCHCSLRTDHKSVIFKKLEKIGEPYSDYCPSGRVIYFQRYKCYQKPIIEENIIWHWADDTLIDLEIKQNKEDMEEKKQKLDDLVGLYSSAQITYKEFDKELKALYTKQGEEDKPVLKPFNLEEAAKAGKPVCTRDGRKARIICFDRRGDKFPIVALLDGCNEEHSEVAETFTNEGLYEIGKKSSNDLVMLSEKKEGWVTIRKTIFMKLKNKLKRLRIILLP